MLNKLAQEVHKVAKEHGWWDNPLTFGEIIALVHSELSEALNEYRNEKGNLYYTCYHPNLGKGEICETHSDAFCNAADDIETVKCAFAKPEGVAIELADAIMRILDYCGRENIDIDRAVKEKCEYNKGRDYRHGGKKL
ncbi:MAG: hypothetical protein FWB90_03930 [Fibromonadales bacterium]|nr:hypothetical protein [Fibromonadales bacterium]